MKVYLGKTQQKVLRYMLENHTNLNPRFTVRELVKAQGVSSLTRSSIKHALRGLFRRGLVTCHEEGRGYSYSFSGIAVHAMAALKEACDREVKPNSGQFNSSDLREQANYARRERVFGYTG